MSTEVTRDADGYVTFEQVGVVHSLRAYPNGLGDGWLFEAHHQGQSTIVNVPQEDAEVLANLILEGTPMAGQAPMLGIYDPRRQA